MASLLIPVRGRPAQGVSEAREAVRGRQDTGDGLVPRLQAR